MAGGLGREAEHGWNRGEPSSVAVRAIVGRRGRGFTHPRDGQSVGGEAVDVPAERSVIVPVSAERFDPALLGFQVPVTFR